MAYSLRWRLLAGLLLSAGLVLPAASAGPQKEQQPRLLLEEATKKELVDGDLKGAIEIYQKILSLEGVPRASLARALLHLGQCYEKLGSTEARKAYERLVREFADQSEETAAARARLAALLQRADSSRRPEMTVRRVWEGPSVDASGAVSRDGAYLTFKEWPSEDLAIHDLATGENRRLTRHRGDLEFVYSSVPSPDSRQVAYSWYNADSFCDLRIVGVNDPEPRILYSNPEVHWLSPTDWSPDARSILAVFPRETGDQIVLMSVSDGSVRILKTLPRGSAGRARFSPDGRYVAYDSPAAGSGGRDIFLLGVGSGREVPLIEHPADDAVIDWTPDGRGVLFRSNRSGAAAAWLIEVSDGNPRGTPELVKPDLAPGLTPLGFTRQGSYYYGVSTPASDVYVTDLDLTTGKRLAPAVLATQRFAGSNNKPDWSPDGRRLVFLSHVGSTSGWEIRALCIRSTETGEVRDLVPKLNRMNWVRWLPDGRSLLAGGNPSPNEGGIYRVDVETGEFARLSDMSLGWPSIPSRDGKTIFRLRWDKVARRILIMERDLETGQERELHRVDAPTVLQSSLALSPNGQQLAFVVGDSENQPKVLKVLPVGGGAARELLRGVQMPFPASVAWSPDGQGVLFVRQPEARNPTCELWLVSLDGGEPRKLDLGAPNIRELSVHPDGRRVAFTSAVDRSEVWVMENFLPHAK